MLKQLLIQNIILIESVDISFGPGLNVLSGETGAGKSAIMHALNLVFGAKADSAMIRKGSEKGIAQAIFELNNDLALLHLLEESGIDHEPEEDLILRREIHQNGKSRCFINNQLASLTLLKTLNPFLGRIIGQHANQWLLSTEKHREIVDVYGELQNDCLKFSLSFTEENIIRKSLNELVQNEQKRFRKIEICKMELQEIEEAKLKEDEDDELFNEYTFLTNTEARSLKAAEICQALNGERLSALALLTKQKSNFEYLAEIDPKIAETNESFKNALMEIQEIAYTMNAYQSRIEYNPQRVQELNERLSLITTLKKKYGSTLAEIENYKIETTKTLEDLENQDLKIEELKAELVILEAKNKTLAADLTIERKKSAKKLQTALIEELRSLNMPKVIFEVEFQSQSRNAKGDDFIEFYLIPNVGEHKIPIKDCASGGELSRILLAIQRLLAGKEQTPTLIFDEIDANIGGETALIVGEKLKEIGSAIQVLCITHFPQVAKQANHHLQISKKEENGRTFTHVATLKNAEERQTEIARMLGGK